MISDIYDDIYFSTHDGIAETQHVFFEGNGLINQWPENTPNIVIAETGFGTGLNFLLTWQLFKQQAKPGQTLDFISFEKHPLTADDIKKTLHHWNESLDHTIEPLCQKLPLRIEGIHPINIAPNMRLILVYGDINQTITNIDADVDYWFLDGFTPSKNPDMWTQTVFDNMARLSHRGTKLATFTAASHVRKGLTDAGFDVERKKGFAHKRHMLCGQMNNGDNKQPAKAPGKTIIIGGGIAGMCMHARLNAAGIENYVYEANTIASGASGNAIAMLNPKLTAKRTPHSDYYSSAYALALNHYRVLHDSYDIQYKQCGTLHLQTDADKTRRFNGYCTALGWHKDHIQRIDKHDASTQTHQSIETSALYYPDAAIASPKQACEAQRSSHVFENKKISKILYINDMWFLFNHNDEEIDSAETLILTAGYEAASLLPSNAPPLSAVRGQVTHIQTDRPTHSNICYGGYVTPPDKKGTVMMGASFQPWDDDPSVRDSDHAENTEKLSVHLPDLAQSTTIIGGWTGFRTSSKDRFPIIGPVVGGDHPNLYLNTAHGSHGMISAPYAAEIIVSMITERTIPCFRQTLRALHTQRF